ncbi:LysR family transcriptional regulator [Rhizobium lemnae]|uniref:LysR family transcriptional regulator n=1 Tax=Rhizobium lemnae TaxID=1214924 RepID=A0ABV8E986_9HYPH|nr:LysR family transcriptional regulator [Rhizobium lemnae]MCJ8508435.1 LysR family transcriptional regulator [Rhizobium lemnae]
MNWDYLRHFAALCSEGSLLGAAKALGTEHATVSRRIEALERKTGLKLVDRRGRRLQLTDDGQRIAALALRMRDEADGIQRILRGKRDEIAGEVTISAPPALSVCVIAPCLASLANRYPLLTVRLLAETRQASLNRREADIAVRLSRPVEGDLALVKLMEVIFRPYASIQLIDKMNTRDMPLIGSDGDVRESPQQQALEQIAHGRPYAFRSSDVIVQFALAKAGAGIAMLPDFLTPEQHGLVSVDPEAKPLVREVWLVIHNDLRNSGPVRAVVDHLRQSIG